MKIKSSARYELLTKALSEGKSLTEAAKEQGVSVALLSQIKKKYSITPVSPSVNQEATASTAEA